MVRFMWLLFLGLKEIYYITSLSMFISLLVVVGGAVANCKGFLFFFNCNDKTLMFTQFYSPGSVCVEFVCFPSVLQGIPLATPISTRNPKTHLGRPVGVCKFFMVCDCSRVYVSMCTVMAPLSGRPLCHPLCPGRGQGGPCVTLCALRRAACVCVCVNFF